MNGPTPSIRRRWQRRGWLLLFLCPLPLAVAIAKRAPVPVPGVVRAAAAVSLDVNAVDRSVQPCDDFYRYACGKWLAENPIPPDQAAWGHGSQLAEWNRQVLREILEHASVDPGKVDKKIGDYYASCMDEKGIEEKGTAALKDELDRIAALKDKAQLAVAVSHLHQLTFAAAPAGDSGATTALFGFGSQQDFGDASRVVAAADQGGLGLPDRDYYLKTDKKSVELRKQYQDHVQRMLGLLGEPAAQAQKDAATVLSVETALAKGAMDIVKRRDPANLNHKLRQNELQALSPSFDWARYLKEIGAPAPQHYLVLTPDFFKALEAEIVRRPIGEWQAYLRWHLLSASAALLPKALRDETFAFYGKTLAGQKEQRPRWKRCVGMADRDLGEALGQAYVDRTFGDEGKRRMLAMVRALEQALSADIRQLDWMTAATKKEAQAKLTAIEDKIGFPNHFRDYSAVSIARGDALGNAQRSSAFELRRQLDKIGKPVDRGEWTMTPPTVNAYYDPQLNTINFPAGILQPPFFDKSMDDAINYGAIGAVIGHELTHGFDDEGRKFDKKGDLRDWWSKQDATAFETRAQCVADQYSGYLATGDIKLNGSLTLGENTADNGGLRIALMAMKKTTGNKGDEKAGKKGAAAGGLTSEQRFFVAYGQSWCANFTPELMRLLATSDPHSPPQYRVNGVVSNMPEFQQAFSCQKGQPMAPAKTCRVW